MLDLSDLRPSLKVVTKLKILYLKLCKMWVTSECGQDLFTSDQTIHNKVTTEDWP